MANQMDKSYIIISLSISYCILDMTEIFFKVVLNTITLIHTVYWLYINTFIYVMHINIRITRLYNE